MDIVFHRKKDEEDTSLPAKIFFISKHWGREFPFGISPTPHSISNPMIRCSALFCKLFQIKKSSDTLYLDFLGKYNLSREACPFCHTSGTLAPFASYERTVVDIVDETTVYNRITVQRMICSSCGHTHAVLPDFLIPYGQYSLPFILRVLWAYFTSSKTVSELCEQVQITPSMLYRWKALFLKHYSLWLSVLQQLETSAQQFICNLVESPCPSEFLHAFFRKTAFSFLQSHQNPANCRRPPP